MAKVQRVEELQVWQAARDVVTAVYQPSSTDTFSRDYTLRDQIRQTAVSIPSNIAEGFSKHSNKEFVPFLFIAKGSTTEEQSQLYTAFDQDYLSQETFDNIYSSIRGSR